MFSIKGGAFFFLHSTVYAAKIGNFCLKFVSRIQDWNVLPAERETNQNWNNPKTLTKQETEVWSN